MADGGPLSAWLVDKPAGPTSHDVVARARRILGRDVKVGHTGTLDPFATGLLVVLVGRATRLARFVSGLDKTYETTVGLGLVSETGDPEGATRSTGVPVPDANAVRRALDGFLGTQNQRVPELSAVKVDGERLHRRARRGERVEPPVRKIEIHELVLRDGPDDRGLARVHVRCGAGTYIRRLVSDLGERLGCGAYCVALRRTAVGRLSVDASRPLDAVRPLGGVALSEVLAHLGTRHLGASEAEAVSHGRPVPGRETGPVALWHAGRLLGVAEGRSDGWLWPAVVLS